MTKILVVEDEPGIALALRDDLTMEGYEVEIARDGDAASQRATETSFDLILLDIMLPLKDGFAVCRELRRRGNRTPILILTAKAQEAEKVLGLELGADDYVTKPFILIRSLEDGSERTVTLQMAVEREIAWSGDGGSLLAVGMGAQGGGVYRVDPVSGAASLLTRKPQFNIAPSADGRALYYSSLQGLYGIEPATAALRTFPPRGSQRIWDLRVSRDGRKLAAISSSSVDIVDIASGSTRPLALPESCWSGDWSPDDRSILATCGVWSQPTKLVRVPLDGSAPVQTQLSGFYIDLRLSPDGKTASLTRWSESRQVWALENFLPGLQASSK